MRVTCEFDTSDRKDYELLQRMFGAEPVAKATEPKVKTTEPAAKPEPKKKPAPKAEPVTPDLDEETPQPVEEPVEEIIEAEVVEEEEEEDLREKVKEKASHLIATGKADIIRSALKEVGAPKVSELTDDDLRPFLDAIEEGLR